MDLYLGFFGTNTGYYLLLYNITVPEIPLRLGSKERHYNRAAR